MSQQKNINTIGRRTFLRNSSLAGGGLILGFSWLNSCKPKQVTEAEVTEMPEEWFEINSYLKIGENGVATIYCPNPEFGQGVMTSMPMLVAEELDIAWDKVMVEIAPYDAEIYGRQFTGGSQGIRTRWEGLRTVGASAKQMLKEAAAKQWEVPVSEISTADGVLTHEPTGNTLGYGEVAAAAMDVAVPEEVSLKSPKDFKIISNSKKNVEGKKIVTGKPMFGVDYQYEGALVAMATHPPAFGLQLKSFDATQAKSMPGIVDVFQIKTYAEDYQRNFFDTNAFTDLVVVVGKSTWEVMNAKKKLDVEWEPFSDYEYTADRFGNKSQVKVPGGLENTDAHYAKMEELASKPGQVVRKDGNPDAAFEKAAKVIERNYTCPFLAHNCMEPMNFFAHVTDEGAKLAGPLQAPMLIEGAIAASLGLPPEKVDIEMTRMGGGFGRRAYAHYAVEAGLISKKVKAPVKLVYSREDDMTFGIYRPSYQATYRAALDENNNLVAFHVKAGGIPETPIFADRFPAGAVDNYMAEQWEHNSNITIGAFRAPRSNFMAGVEQAFLDEVAELAGKDPIEFRLELLDKAMTNPVGETNDYEADRLAGVLKLVRDKSDWGTDKPGVFRGVAAYFCHNTYAAHVIDVVKGNDGTPRVENAVCAMDCGIVVNPDAAANMCEGGIVDGVGNAMYGGLTFREGAAQQDNFDKYRIIRHSEAPKNIEVHFIQNEIDPTGLGEPPFPPVMGALANALYKAEGRRRYNQPFISDKPELVG